MFPQSRCHNETIFIEVPAVNDAGLHFKFGLRFWPACSGSENKAAIRPRLDFIPASILAHTFLKDFSNMLIFLVIWHCVIWFAEPGGQNGYKKLILVIQTLQKVKFY